MLVLLTDFGWNDPYVGQVKSRLWQSAPQQPIVDLLHSVPDFNAHAGAHLLAALAHQFPVDSVFLCVVDPGVGGARPGAVIKADGRWFVGPDNGLLSVLAARAQAFEAWRITWQPEGLSASFHARDLFSPLAAALASGNFPHEKLAAIDTLEVNFDAADLPRVIYIDHYGNAWTGVRGGLASPETVLEVNGVRLPHRHTFSAAGKGEAFWYVNSVGLLELAANRASAAQKLGIKVGDMVKLSESPDSRLH